MGIELGHLGNAYLHLGQRLPSPEGNTCLQQAIEHYTQALAIDRKVGNRQGEGGGLGNLGNAYRALGQYKEAAEHYTQALEISRAIGDRRGEGTDLNNLGLMYLNDLKDPTAALPWLQQSRATFDALWDEITTDERRVSFGDIFSDVGRALQLAHAQLGQHTSSLEEAERARSRAFELLLSQQRLATPAAVGSTEKDASSPADAQPLRFDELLAVAEEQHVTIVVFSQITQSQLLGWVLRGGDTSLTMEQISILPDDKSLAQLIELIVAGANEGGASPTETAAIALAALLSRCHELLIKPLGLVDGEPLLIIPDRDLYALPFAAMVDSEGKYLIERHSVRVAPSVGTVIELQRRAAARPPPSKPSAMVVGDPSFGGSDCSRDDVGSDSSVCWAQSLPGARKEARRIKSLLEDTDAYDGAVKKMVGDEAGKVAVVEAMRGCDVIHLATHGEPGAVLLGGATRAEGALSMAEVQRLELEARLVVLSECDSFRGKLTSDGVIGVSRAFVAAGALTLVASLWKVDDDATFALMSHFYTALLLSGGLGDAASALRSAMVAMIHEKRWSMLQWAGFVVYGLASAKAGKPLVTSSSDSSNEHGTVASAAQTRSSEVEVEYAVTGPASVALEATVFSLKVWAMIDAQVERFAKTFQRLLEQGDKDHAHQLDDLDDAVSQLRVRVSVVGCTVEPRERTVQWNRKIVSSPHSVLVPADFSGNLSCTVVISDDSPEAMRDRDLFEQTFVIERGSVVGVAQLLAANELIKARLVSAELRLGALEQQVLNVIAEQQQLRENVRKIAMSGADLDQLNKAVVALGVGFDTTPPKLQSGTGFLVHPDGHLVTDHHVLLDMDNPTGPTGASRQYFVGIGSPIVWTWTAKVLDWSATARQPSNGKPEHRHMANAPWLDLCVMKLESLLNATGALTPFVGPVPALALGDSDAIETGQPVWVLGYGQHINSPKSTSHTCPGAFAGRDPDQMPRLTSTGPVPTPSELLMVTADMLAGHSGGPAVVRQNDQLVVIGWSIMSTGDTVVSDVSPLRPVNPSEVRFGDIQVQGTPFGTSAAMTYWLRPQRTKSTENCGGLHGLRPINLAKPMLVNMTPWKP